MKTNETTAKTVSVSGEMLNKMCAWYDSIGNHTYEESRRIFAMESQSILRKIQILYPGGVLGFLSVNA